jgi:hypothetical protein
MAGKPVDTQAPEYHCDTFIPGTVGSMTKPQVRPIELNLAPGYHLTNRPTLRYIPDHWFRFQFLKTTLPRLVNRLGYGFPVTGPRESSTWKNPFAKSLNKLVKIPPGRVCTIPQGALQRP